MTRSRLIVVATAIVGLNLLALGLALLDRSEVVDGPAGSSYVTTARGTAALAETLDRIGIDVERRRSPLGSNTLAGAGTYVVVEAGSTGYSDGEVAEIRRFAESGGTVVVAGRPDENLLDAIAQGAPRWEPGGRDLHEVWLPPAWSLPVSALSGSGTGSWNGGEGAAAAGGGEQITVLTLAVGEGLVHLVADAGMLSNDHIDQEDNAVWAAGLLETGPVVFDEYRHGFTEEPAGPAGALLPPAWERSLPLMAVAVLVVLVAYGRRTAPIRPEADRSSPERILYVEGLASALARAGRPGEAVEPIRREALEILGRRVGLSPTPSEDEVVGAARTAGLSEDQGRILARGATGAHQALEIDRALAALRREEEKAHAGSA